MSKENYEPHTSAEVIPRPIGRVRALLVPKFKLGLIDILVAISVIATFATISFTLVPNLWLKMVFGLVIPLVVAMILLVGEPNRRVYNNLYKLFIYLVSKKKYIGADVDKLVPYTLLEEKYVRLKGVGKNASLNGKWVSVIKINGNNIANMKEGQQDHMLKQLANLFVGQTSSFFITKQETPFNTDKQQAHIKELLSKYKNDKYREPLLAHNLGLANLVGHEDNSVSSYFIVIANKDKLALEEELSSITSQLVQASVHTERLTGYHFKRYILRSLKPSLKGLDVSKETDYSTPTNVIDLLGLKQVEVKGSHIKFDNLYARVIAIDQYPIKSSLAWLAPVFNIASTSVYLRVQGLAQVEANKLLDKAHQEMRLRAIGTNVAKLSENSNQAIYMGAMEELAEKIQGTGERLMNTQLYLVIYADTYKDLRVKERLIFGELGKNKMKVDKLAFKQLEAYLSLSPNGDVNNFYTRNTLECGSSALSHSWPFLSESFNDKTGFYIGMSHTDKPVFLDWAYRNSAEGRNQSNSIIFGATGKGKSTFVKKVLKDEFAGGTKCYVIDPENEYEDLCKNLGGTYIDLSGKPNSKGVIERLNPLQPFASTEEGRNSLDNHFKFLEAFFKATLYPSVQDVVKEMSYLKYAIAELYKIKKVKQNDKADKWPIITDLYNHLVKLSKTKPKASDLFADKALFKEIAERLYDLTKNGTDGNLWDGVTTLNIEDDEFVVFNIQELYSAGNKRLTNSQMFLMLNYLEYLTQRNKRANAKLSAGEKKTISITIDEAHLLVNKDNPTTLQFAYNTYKRIRKYDGWVRFVTQNIADFTGSEDVKRETSAILNSAQFMFIFGLNPKDIKDLDDLLRENGGLTDYEKGFLNIGETHSAIFLSGSQYRSTIMLDYTDEEKQVWGWKADPKQN